MTCAGAHARRDGAAGPGERLGAARRRPRLSGGGRPRGCRAAQGCCETPGPTQVSIRRLSIQRTIDQRGGRCPAGARRRRRCVSISKTRNGRAGNCSRISDMDTLKTGTFFAVRPSGLPVVRVAVEDGGDRDSG